MSFQVMDCQFYSLRMFDIKMRHMLLGLADDKTTRVRNSHHWRVDEYPICLRRPTPNLGQPSIMQADLYLWLEYVVFVDAIPLSHD